MRTALLWYIFSPLGLEGIKVKATAYNNKDKSRCENQAIQSEDSASVGQQIKIQDIRI